MIIIRLKYPDGTIRLNIDENTNFENLLNEISKKTGYKVGNFDLKFKENLINLKNEEKIMSLEFIENGVIINCIPNSEAIEEKKVFEDERKKKIIEAENKLTNKCNHGPGGKCLNCISTDDKVEEKKTEKAEDKEKIIEEKVEDEEEIKEEDKDYIEEVITEKELNEIVKHISFDKYLVNLTYLCKGHPKSMKCSYCTLPLSISYKVKYDCTNHKRYPLGMCNRCIPPNIIAKRQIYRHVDYCQFNNYSEFNNFISLWTNTLNQRVGFLYGYYVQDPLYDKGVRAVIECIYEPPQECDYNGYLLYEDPFRYQADIIAEALGFERLGWIIVNNDHDQFLSPKNIIQAAKYQMEHSFKHPIDTSVPKWLTIVVKAIDGDLNKIVPDVYMVSDQFQSLISNDIIDIEKSIDKKLIIRDKKSPEDYVPEFLYGSEAKKEIEPDFFIVNIASGQPKTKKFNVMKNYDFPVENRLENLQEPFHIKEYLKKYSKLHVNEKYSNFHLLLYISKIIDLKTSTVLANNIRDGIDISPDIDIILESMVE